MNIAQAKETIKNTIGLYLKKDEFGDYRIPVVRQRPIFLLGAPGIGKTAIMEQIAQEMGVALVAYSMTHHTRQSALGLPFITHKTYGEEEFAVSEYTMSEIIASVYDTMEESGVREGILFLDEINCVSETLAPSMLQFLQYKVFGRHSVPDGWVIVTAGNPPEFNRSVREFDVVTMDRMKLLEVEPDLDSWMKYARERGLHGAVLGYLELKKEHFYVMEMTAKGRSYVTARGWEDLSQILKLYEEEELKADEALIGQYLHNQRVVKEFGAYYDLYCKYKRDYHISEILEGEVSPSTIARAKSARFDERISLVSMLLDRVLQDCRSVMGRADVMTQIAPVFRTLKEKAQSLSGEEAAQMLGSAGQGKEKQLKTLKTAGALSDAEKAKLKAAIQVFDEAQRTIRVSGARSGEEAFAAASGYYGKAVAQLQKEAEGVQKELRNLFGFSKEAFAEGNELLLLLTQLTVSDYGARFIGTFGSPEYEALSRDLMVSERRNELAQEIAKLDL
ncbi:MAG: AAA family ATPase [Lachnospiraceae bacterium]|nr:AAA family ATPase [Lachnospiraceae bacterium]